jgi:hypothetical protein
MAKDELGNAYGKLTVMAPALPEGGKAAWVCKCKCGGLKVVTGDALRQGRTTSCGCIWRIGSPAHGHASHMKGVSRTYRTWQEMRARCSNPNHISYPNYGGRGIAVAPEWDSFEAFFRDMGERPVGMSIDRVDGNLGYSKANCVWSSCAVQNNRCNVRLIAYRGKKQSLAQWCRELKIPYQRTYHRMNVQKLSFELAVKSKI